MFANVDKDGEPLPSGAEYEEVDVASGGYVVPLMYVSENKKAVDAGDSSRKKILGGQHFLWGEPEVTGDLTLMEYDVNPATRATEPFFDRVYFAVKAGEVHSPRFFGPSVHSSVHSSVHWSIHRSLNCFKEGFN